VHAVAQGRKFGEVWLVGAGPGDPGLLTVRGRELLSTADVVVADRLATAVLLAEAPPTAEIIHVGKSPTARSWRQEEINAVLVDRALAGARVVRLKGGDPYVLGRGGEEAAACAEAGVPCAVVPGITSALAVPALAGIPVTHRDVAQEIAIVSGHLPPGHPASTVDWSGLAASKATIVILMGVARLMAIADALLAGGRAESTPVAMIERGATPAQRVLRTTLDALAVDAIAAGVRSPAVIVVGEVAARDDASATPDALPLASTPPLSGTPAQTGTFPATGPLPSNTLLSAGGSPRAVARPLAGIRILVARTRPRPGLLARELRTLGADAVETVVVRPVPAPDAGPQLVAALPGAAALLLADPDEVAAVVAALRRAGTDVRALAGLALVAARPDAAAALDALGLATITPDDLAATNPDVQSARTPDGQSARTPDGQSARAPGGQAVVTSGGEAAAAVAPVLIVGAAEPPAGGPWTVRRVRLLTDETAEPDPRIAEEVRHGDFDVVALASSTAARGTAELYGPLPPDLLVAAMGRRSAEACESAGLRVDIVPAEPGVRPLADAVADFITATRAALDAPDS
jgi:uroporphyrinogen III methyltransferase/synthase